MAARYIINRYTNKKGNTRVSILMSEELAGQLAVSDKTATEQLAEALADKLADTEAE